MKFERLQDDASLTVIRSKVNELIDFLNNNFITDDPNIVKIEDLQNLVDITCDTLTPKTNEHTLNGLVADKIDPKYIFDDMCLKTEPNPWSDKKCPHCDESYYTPGASITTALYCPPIYKNGVNVNKMKNTSKTTYHCCACGRDWTEET